MEAAVLNRNMAFYDKTCNPEGHANRAKTRHRRLISNLEVKTDETGQAEITPSSENMILK